MSDSLFTITQAKLPGLAFKCPVPLLWEPRAAGAVGAEPWDAIPARKREMADQDWL